VDYNTYLFIIIAAMFSFVGLVVWFADRGIPDKYNLYLTYSIMAVCAALGGLFFMVEDIPNSNTLVTRR